LYLKGVITKPSLGRIYPEGMLCSERLGIVKMSKMSRDVEQFINKLTRVNTERIAGSLDSKRSCYATEASRPLPLLKRAVQ